MIYVTGDTHHVFNRFSKENFPEQEEMTKEDYLIICGDFGGVWTGDNCFGQTCIQNRYGMLEEASEAMMLDALDQLPFTILFVDGNHENFDFLYKYPVKEWHGGLVHEVRPSVLHLMRGHIFDIDGKKCFAFGGAKSHDTWGGIFEKDDPELKRKIQRARRNYEPYRINHESWWKEEQPSYEEMDFGLVNLENHNWSVDFVFTHECASSTMALLYGPKSEDYPLTQYLERVHSLLKYTKWFFGHHHNNQVIDDKDILLYEQIIRIH